MAEGIIKAQAYKGKINHGFFYNMVIYSFISVYKTHKETLEMPYWNLLCLWRICLFVYVFSVMKNKITKPYVKKFDGLLVNDDKIVN